MKLSYCTKQKSIILFDVVLSRIKIHKHYLQLLAVTCVLISIKSEESFCYQLVDACNHCQNAYTTEEVANMEMVILKTLKWKINYPTPGEIARNLLKLSEIANEEKLPLLYNRIDSVIELFAIGIII